MTTSVPDPTGMTATEIRARLVIVARHLSTGPGTWANSSLLAGLINSASVPELWSMRLAMRAHRASGTHTSTGIQDPTYDSLESDHDSGSSFDSDPSSGSGSPMLKLLPILGTEEDQESSSSDEQVVPSPRTNRAPKLPPTRRRDRILERDDPDRINTSEEVSGASQDSDSSSFDLNEHHPGPADRARSTSFQDPSATGIPRETAKDDLPVRAKERWLYPDAKVGSLPWRDTFQGFNSLCQRAGVLAAQTPAASPADHLSDTTPTEVFAPYLSELLGPRPARALERMVRLVHLPTLARVLDTPDGSNHVGLDTLG